MESSTQAKVKVFGERNTGTRAACRMIDAAHGVARVRSPKLAPEFAARLAALRRDVECAFPGPWRRVYNETLADLRATALGPLYRWKHACPEYVDAFRDEGVGVLFLHRNPYSWALSLHRRPYHYLGPRQLEFSQFIRVPWKTTARDNAPPLLRSALELWNCKLRAYLDFAQRAASAGVPTAMVAFEDIATRPATAMEAALRALGAEPRGLATLAPTKPNGQGAEARREYYEREAWKGDLCRNDVAFINGMIDWPLARELGYAALDPADFPVSLHRKTGAATAA